MKTRPVATSVMLIRYSTMTPLMSAAGGGAQVRDMEVELTGASTTLRGGLVGAEGKKRWR